MTTPRLEEAAAAGGGEGSSRAVSGKGTPASASRGLPVSTGATGGTPAGAGGGAAGRGAAAGGAAVAGAAVVAAGAAVARERGGAAAGEEWDGRSEGSFQSAQASSRRGADSDAGMSYGTAPSQHAGSAASVSAVSYETAAESAMRGSSVASFETAASTARGTHQRGSRAASSVVSSRYPVSGASFETAPESFGGWGGGTGTTATAYHSR